MFAGRPDADLEAPGARYARHKVFCPNCMSPHVEPLPPDPEAPPGPDPPEPTIHCTECEYAAPRSEFVPENYR